MPTYAGSAIRAAHIRWNAARDWQARKAELKGRTGLGIHGGRGDAVLKATHGCVRLKDRDMADFARIAGKLRFTVEIREEG